MLPAGFVLRPVTTADRPFLSALLATTSAVAHAPLPAAQVEALIAMQLDAQERAHRARFPRARVDVIERAGEPIGRVSVDRGVGEVRLIDVAIAPAWRGRGIGTAIVATLQEEAARDDRRVALYVARDNPALRLYERLGFRVIAEDAIGLEMAWAAS